MKSKDQQQRKRKRDFDVSVRPINRDGISAIENLVGRFISQSKSQAESQPSAPNSINQTTLANENTVATVEPLVAGPTVIRESSHTDTETVSNLATPFKLETLSTETTVVENRTVATETTVATMETLSNLTPVSDSTQLVPATLSRTINNTSINSEIAQDETVVIMERVVTGETVNPGTTEPDLEFEKRSDRDQFDLVDLETDQTQTIVIETTIVTETPKPLSQRHPQTPVKETRVVTETPPFEDLEARGTTQIPNSILDKLLPKLDPAEQLIYLRLYRLSHGFHKDKCLVGLDKLAESCNLGKSTVIRMLKSLEAKQLIKKLETKLGGNIYARGNYFWVYKPLVTETTVANLTPVSSETTVVRETTNKDHDHEDLLNKDLQTAHERETMITYQSITGNKWGRADRESYKKIAGVTIDKIAQVMREVTARAPQKPGSLAYFVKEILNPSQTNPAAKSANRARLRAIIERLSQANIGRTYSLGELADDTKLACAREGLLFDNDLFNDIIASRSRSGD